jgi:hypothetical protein
MKHPADVHLPGLDDPIGKAARGYFFKAPAKCAAVEAFGAIHVMDIQFAPADDPMRGLRGIRI